MPRPARAQLFSLVILSLFVCGMVVVLRCFVDFNQPLKLGLEVIGFAAPATSGLASWLSSSRSADRPLQDRFATVVGWMIVHVLTAAALFVFLGVMVSAVGN